MALDGLPGQGQLLRDLAKGHPTLEKLPDPTFRRAQLLQRTGSDVFLARLGGPQTTQRALTNTT